jgi:hypothetical protein
MRLGAEKNGFSPMIMNLKHPLLLLVSSIILLCSFSQDVGYYDSYDQTPILMLRSDFEKSIKTSEPREMNFTTRINLKDSYIYIVELYKGVHVVNNADPSSPEVIHFINIPGCVDMVIKGDQLFARSAVDLVAIDISDLAAVKEISNSRVRETFSELGIGSLSYNIPYKFTKDQRPENTIIVGWENSKIN